MPRRAVDWPVLCFATLWFSVLVPVHNRGEIKPPGTAGAAAAHHCCPAEFADHHRDAPDPRPVQSTCAVCCFIAALNIAPPVTKAPPPVSDASGPTHKHGGADGTGPGYRFPRRRRAATASTSSRSTPSATSAACATHASPAAPTRGRRRHWTGNAAATGAYVLACDATGGWSAPQPLAADGGRGRNTDVATSGRSVVAVRDQPSANGQAVYSAVSPDAGATWPAPRRLSPPDQNATYPRVVETEGRFVVLRTVYGTDGGTTLQVTSVPPPPPAGRG